MAVDTLATKSALSWLRHPRVQRSAFRFVAEELHLLDVSSQPALVQLAQRLVQGLLLERGDELRHELHRCRPARHLYQVVDVQHLWSLFFLRSWLHFAQFAHPKPLAI